MASPRNKAKATPKEVPQVATPETETPDTEVPDIEAPALATPTTATRKRKVDWATIDERKPFRGFTLKAAKAKTPKKSARRDKKQKTASTTNGETGYRDAPLGADIVQQNPFQGGELSETHYQVKPVAEWESTQRYRKFTISDAEFEVGQVVFVKTREGDYDITDPSQHGIARVLEIRAGDSAHVFLRVYWLYSPEDLPEGRQPHHGESELIASNHMDIIEAMTVVDGAEVVHWDEDPDKSWPLRQQLFWRQTLDITKPKAQQLSPLRPFCIDQAPCNPDEPLINCPSCSSWLHAHCLEDRAVQAAYNAHAASSQSKKKGALKSSSASSFKANLTTQPSGQTCLTITDLRRGKSNQRWNVDVTCLLCNSIIENAADALPSSLASDEDADEDSVTEAIAVIPATPTPAAGAEASVDSQTNGESAEDPDPPSA